MAGSIDDFLDRYKAPVEEVPICGRADLIAEFAALEADIAGDTIAAALSGPPEVKVARLRELQAEIDESVFVVTLRGLSFSRWMELKAEHPPSAEDAAKGHDSDPNGWEPAVVAACASDPTMTVEQAERMRDTVAATEWGALLRAVGRLHSGQHTAPKSLLLSALPQPNSASSDTPDPGESPEAGSLAGPGEQ